MPVPKYDWIELKKEFLASNDSSVRQFCRRKGLQEPSKNSYIANRTAGWQAEKERIRSRALEIYAEKVSEDMFTDVKALRLEQAKAARLASKKAAEYILNESSKIKSVDEARKLFESAAKIQNTALGVGDRKSGDQRNLTQINIVNNTFSELLEEGNEEEIISLLSAVRNTREARRTDIDRIGELSEAEAREEITGESE